MALYSVNMSSCLIMLTTLSLLGIPSRYCCYITNMKYTLRTSRRIRLIRLEIMTNNYTVKCWNTSVNRCCYGVSKQLSSRDETDTLLINPATSKFLSRESIFKNKILYKNFGSDSVCDDFCIRIKYKLYELLQI